VGEGKKRPKRAHIAHVKYDLYFFDHTPIESTEGKTVDVVMGEIAWPEGLWKGLEKMRKGEKAKVKIQKKYSFGRKELREKLIWPKGFEPPEENNASENHTRLLEKGVIYEVELVDWTERVDVNGDSVFIKEIISKSAKKSYMKPKEIDEVTIDIKIE
jgi:FKBP-type peptidyl-prolyl cis-trans isomerase 2